MSATMAQFMDSSVSPIKMKIWGVGDGETEVVKTVVSSQEEQTHGGYTVYQGHLLTQSNPQNTPVRQSHHSFFFFFKAIIPILQMTN